MPKNTIEIERFQDIQIPDQQLRTQYIDLYQRGAVGAAHNLLSQEQLRGKALTANNVNAISSAILYLENLYFQYGPDTLTELLDGLNKSLDGIAQQGDYAEGQEYQMGNFVSKDGEVYMAAKDGIYPLSDTSAWIYLGLRGEQGALGFGLNLRGAWRQDLDYAPLDIVNYQNALYVARVSNTDTIPPSSPATWCLALQIFVKGIIVSETEPEKIDTGDFWWETYPREGG